MSTASPPHRRPPITDSPWFWAYVFATGALAALLLGGPRFFDRQEQLDRQFAARQRSGQVVVGTQGPVPVAASGSPLISLKPLVLVMALSLSLAWVVFWSQRRGHLRRTPRDSQSVAVDDVSSMPPQVDDAIRENPLITFIKKV